MPFNGESINAVIGAYQRQCMLVLAEK